MGRGPLILSPGAEEKLLRYSFPGNIRELENILERALIYGEGRVIRPDDIDLRRSPEDGPLQPVTAGPEPAEPETAGTKAPPPPEEPDGRDLAALEKKAIREALARNGGNRTRAAEELGISRKTILNKIKAYGLRL
jgi:two-component system response regulator AtoC